MLTPTQSNKIKLVRNAHAIDKMRRKKIALQPKKKMLGFKQYLARKAELGEAVVGSETVDSFMCWLPNAADDSEKAITASQIADAVIQLAATGDVTVTGVSVIPDGASQ